MQHITFIISILVCNC